MRSSRDSFLHTSGLPFPGEELALLNTSSRALEPGEGGGQGLLGERCPPALSCPRKLEQIFLRGDSLAFLTGEPGGMGELGGTTERCVVAVVLMGETGGRTERCAAVLTLMGEPGGTTPTASQLLEFLSSEAPPPVTPSKPDNRRPCGRGNFSKHLRKALASFTG